MRRGALGAPRRLGVCPHLGRANHNYSEYADQRGPGGCGVIYAVAQAPAKHEMEMDSELPTRNMIFPLSPQGHVARRFRQDLMKLAR
jgi:hypothetical protein